MRTGRKVGFRIAARVGLRVTLQDGLHVAVQIGRRIAAKTRPPTSSGVPLGIAPGTVPGTVPTLVRGVSFLVRLEVPNRIYFGHLGQYRPVLSLRLPFPACAIGCHTRKTAGPSCPVAASGYRVITTLVTRDASRQTPPARGRTPGASARASGIVYCVTASRQRRRTADRCGSSRASDRTARTSRSVSSESHPRCGPSVAVVLRSCPRTASGSGANGGSPE
jgi:hypothetical protein